MILSDLPEQLLAFIFRYLAPHELLRSVCLVAKRFKAICEHFDNIWQGICKRQSIAKPVLAVKPAEFTWREWFKGNYYYIGYLIQNDMHQLKQ